MVMRDVTDKDAVMSIRCPENPAKEMGPIQLMHLMKGGREHSQLFKL